jgi:hypothetical protein
MRVLNDSSVIVTLPKLVNSRREDMAFAEAVLRSTISLSQRPATGPHMC